MQQTQRYWIKLYSTGKKMWFKFQTTNLNTTELIKGNGFRFGVEISEITYHKFISMTIPDILVILDKLSPSMFLPENSVVNEGDKFILAINVQGHYTLYHMHSSSDSAKTVVPPTTFGRGIHAFYWGDEHRWQRLNNSVKQRAEV